ncbi:MAG: S1 RNA-binding domain-containing protein [Psychrobacillus sp.]
MVSKLEMEYAQAWADIKEAYRQREKKHVFTAKAIGIEKLELNGHKQEVLKLYYNGVYGYIPKSLMDDYDFRSLQSFVGAEFDFVVTQLIEEAGERLFLGNRKLALEYQAEKFWRNAKEAQRFEAFVSGVDRFNVYVLIQGVRTRLSREDYSHVYEPDLQNVVFIGDTIEVAITELDKENKKVEVSRKVLEEDPMSYLREYKVKGSYQGTIINIDIDNGIFVRLEPRGLIARAGFPPGMKSSILEVGTQVNFKVTNILEKKGHIHGIIIIPRTGQLNRAKGRVYG